jgi:hypothetical protein
MPARVHKIRHDEETRAKIKAAQIINRLQQCIDGEVELSAQQVSAAKTLLDKALPNLQAIEMEATHDVSDPLADLLFQVAAQGARLVDSDGGNA